MGSDGDEVFIKQRGSRCVGMKGLTKLSLSPGLEPRQGCATLRNGSEHPDSSDFTPHTSAGLKPPPPRFHSQQKCSPSLQGRQTKGRGSHSSPSEDDPLGVCGSSRGKIGEWARLAAPERLPSLLPPFLGVPF